MNISLVLLVFFVLANASFVTEKFLFLFAIKSNKTMFYRVIEIVIYYIFALLLAIIFESNYSGEIYSQQWEFYITTFSLFLVFSVPGLIYQYQWKPINKKYQN